MYLISLNPEFLNRNKIIFCALVAFVSEKMTITQQNNESEMKAYYFETSSLTSEAKVMLYVSMTFSLVAVLFFLLLFCSAILTLLTFPMFEVPIEGFIVIRLAQALDTSNEWNLYIN